MKLNFKQIQNELLSPGDIFWEKTSGPLLLSKKGEPLNLNLIKKIDNAGHSLIIENRIDIHSQQEMNEIYERYSNEIMMRDKMKWRTQFIDLLRVEYIEKNKEQSEMNILCWRIFSKFTKEDGVKFIERDSELFIRHLSVASSYAISAFLLGYYEPVFLSKIFCTSLKNLMELGESVNALSLKEKLDYLCLQDSFNNKDYELVKDIASTEVIEKTVVFEKYDGSGLRRINAREMSDLEVMLVAINGAYGFKSTLEHNFLHSIQNNKIPCEMKTLKMLQRVLTKTEKETILEVG